MSTSASRVSLRSLTVAAAEHAAARAARKGVTIMVRVTDGLRSPAAGRLLLRDALTLLADDAVARAPRGTVVQLLARRTADAIVFEVRDADTAAHARMRPAHARARLVAGRAGWHFRVATDRWAGTRAILATPQRGQRPGRRAARWTTCIFSIDENFVMPGPSALRMT